MTLLFYAGSAQMATLQLLQDQALPIMIILTTIVINLRFLMYSAALSSTLHPLPLRWRWPMIYMISDQSFALSMLQRQQSGDRINLWFMAGTAVLMWLVWQLSVLLGVIAGARIPASWSLEFAIPLSFLAILVPAIRNFAGLSAAVTGAIVAILARSLPYNSGLILASICGISIGLFIESWHYNYSKDTQ